MDQPLKFVSARSQPLSAPKAEGCDQALACGIRLLASLAGNQPKTLAGIIEGDETFILGSFKGKRSDLPRRSRKRGGKTTKRGLSAEQIRAIAARNC
jgi:hypothetical protein